MPYLFDFRFLPACVPDHMNVVINETEKLKPVELGKKLDFPSWLIAFDRCWLACTSHAQPMRTDSQVCLGRDCP